MKQDLRGTLGASIAMFACFALAVPSQALAKDVSTSRTKAASANASGETATSPKAAKPHCMKIEALTGSRMPKHKCKTIAEWEELGYEFKSNR